MSSRDGKEAEGRERRQNMKGWKRNAQETFPARRPPKCGCPQRFRATSLPRTCVSCLFTPRCCDTVVKLQSRHSRDTVATQSRHSRDMVFLAFPAREHKRSTSPENCLIPRARFAKKTMSRLCRDCVATVSRPCRDCVATVWHLPWAANANKSRNLSSEGPHFTCMRT